MALQTHGIRSKDEKLRLMENLLTLAPDQTMENEVRGDVETNLFHWSNPKWTEDFVFKATAATVLLFMSFPWAAFFWPPYYWFTKRDDK